MSQYQSMSSLLHKRERERERERESQSMIKRFWSIWHLNVLIQTVWILTERERNEEEKMEDKKPVWVLSLGAHSLYSICQL